MINSRTLPRKSEKNRRHCMIVHAYYPLGEPRVEREALALVDQSYHVDVICLKNDGEKRKETVNGVNIYRLPVKRLKWKKPIIQLMEYLAFFILASIQLNFLYLIKRYDVIQTHNLPDFLIFSAAFPKLMGAKLILDIHDLMPEFFAASSERDMQSWMVRLLILEERLSCSFANHVITVSELWRQRLIERGVPAEKCSVVMNLADENIFYMRSNSAADDSSRFRLIYHGTLVFRYGLDLAIKAIQRVRKEIPEIHLVILGNSTYVNDLIQMVRELDLEQNVSILNELRPTRELPDLILTARLGVVPYRNDRFTDELLPTKLMEYAALGVPAIAARTSAIESYFKDTMVELFDPGDFEDLARCILALYQSPSRLAELKEGCSIFNERYNWNKTRAGYLALVDGLISQKGLASERYTTA